MESEIKTLFPAVECHGVKIKPWGLFQIAKISPHLSIIIDELKKKGIAVESFESRISDVILIMLPHMPDIVKISTGLTQEKIEEMEPDHQIALATEVIKSNISYLKNFFRVPTAKAETPTTAGSHEPSSLS